MRATQMQQILGPCPGGPDSKAFYAQQHERYQDILLETCPAHLWYKNSYRSGCPRPILISNKHQKQLEGLHEALVAAITDIVPRWWTDKERDFPRRMPLERVEEDLLKWLDVQVSRGNLPEFSKCLGSWRPDFLVEDLPSTHPDGPAQENFTITEINARFSFNGFVHESYGQQAIDRILEDNGLGTAGLMSATDHDVIIDGLFSLFDPEYPLHLLKGEEKGVDIHMFIDIVEHRLGIKPRLIKPADLRLVPDARSETGYRLFCVCETEGYGLVTQIQAIIYHDGEVLEEIHQIGLELHQREIVALQPELLKQVSLACFNDMRTILLVHDKRMLGIIKEELPDLVARKMLNEAQATQLNRGIVDTMLPASPLMASLRRKSENSTTFKNNFILKPVRSGKGDGIVFGEDMSAEEWVEALRCLQQPSVSLGSAYVVQRQIRPRPYDLVLKPSGDLNCFPLVGTYHATNGRLLGLGTWRASGDRIVAVTSGGAWICSVIRRD